jgi:hypothetical protein
MNLPLFKLLLLLLLTVSGAGTRHHKGWRLGLAGRCLFARILLVLRLARNGMQSPPIPINCDHSAIWRDDHNRAFQS